MLLSPRSKSQGVLLKTVPPAVGCTLPTNSTDLMNMLRAMGKSDGKKIDELKKSNRQMTQERQRESVERTLMAFEDIRLSANNEYLRQLEEAQMYA